MHEIEFPLKPYIPPDSTCEYKGARFDVHSLKRGSTKRDVVNHPGAVVILPILDFDHIALIQNERFAVGEVLWELPAGTLEENEPPEDSALRELHEETGYKCKRITPLTFFYTTPGFCNERMFAYLAEDLTKGDQQLDETEKIIVEIFTWEEVFKMIKSNKIRDAKTLAVLFYYDKFYSNKTQ